VLNFKLLRSPFISNVYWATPKLFSMIVGTTEAESWRCRFPSRQTFQEAAKILNISTARLRVLLMAGRVEGAYKTGKMWLMPLFNGKPIIKRGTRGPAPRWRNPRKPGKTIIHVNSHRIRQNQKQNLTQPVITVKKRKVGGVVCRPAKLFKKPCNSLRQSHSFSEAGLLTSRVDSPTNGILNLYGHEVEILGGCRVVYRRVG
jgi:hypothetical protein